MTTKDKALEAKLLAEAVMEQWEQELREEQPYLYDEHDALLEDAILKMLGVNNADD